MPMTGRLGAPGVLHHIMIRGIQRQRIFSDIQDRDDLLERLSVILPETHTSCYARPVFLRDASLIRSAAV
jgi:putative transposase